MPKLQGIEDKYINGIKVDKENKDVFFNDETHKYYDKKTMQPYISVTVFGISGAFTSDMHSQKV